MISVCWRRLLRVFWTVRRSNQSILTEIKPVNPKGNQPWILIWRADAEAEAPILWPPDVKSRLIGKDPDAGKDWRQDKSAIGVRWINGIADAMDMNMGKLWEMVRDKEAWCAAIHVVAKSWTQLGNWTTTWGKRLPSKYVFLWSTIQSDHLFYPNSLNHFILLPCTVFFLV